MKVSILTASVSRSAGGILDAVRRLSVELASLGPAQVEILSMEDDHTECDRSLWQPLRPQTFPILGPRAFGYAPRMADVLRELQPDLLHVVGLWLYPSVAALRWSRRSCRPYLISPHGMLDPWALHSSRWKKRLAGWLYENAHLRRTACLHALCAAEAAAIRGYGLSNPICIIPNGIDLPRTASAGKPPWHDLWGDRYNVLLFLGRLHPKKGLPGLLQAWTTLQRDLGACLADWRLAIVGWDQGGHAQKLQRLIDEAGRGEDVHLFGPAFGDAKDAALRCATAFVLPSLSEGMPMAVLEAHANGLPVLLTPQCNLPESIAAGAAVQADPTSEGLARGLAELFSLSPAQRREMGMQGRRLVAEKFAWPRISRQMLEVYQWALGGGPRPASVLEN